MTVITISSGIESTKSPPEFGSLVFSLLAKPVSLQGSREKQAEIQELVKEITRPVRYLLSGELKLDIEWYVHERDRWESAAAPDIDNIMKPLLDGLSGPDGIMVDDCQVQEIACRWIDWASHTNELRFELRFHPDDYIRKEKLVFVHVGRNLYMPLNTEQSPEIQRTFLDTWSRMTAARNKIEGASGDNYTAKHEMPVQRAFHGARLRSFTKVEASDLALRDGHTI